MMMNPVLRREARTSLRSWKIYATLMGYVGLVAICAGLFVWSSASASYYSGFSPQVMTTMYVTLCCFQFGLLLLITPALTGGSISGERERQTLDLLLLTKMSPFSIVFGKLASSLGLALLLTIATLPIFAIVFYFGGVSLLSLVLLTGYMILVSCMFGAIAIFFSSVFRKTVVSMVLTYIVEGLLCGGTVVAYGIYSIVSYSMYEIEPTYVSTVLFLLPNPAATFGILLDKQIGFGIMDEIFEMYSYYSNGTVMNIPFVVEYFWLLNIIFCILVTGFFLFLAARCINPLRRK